MGGAQRRPRRGRSAGVQDHRSQSAAEARGGAEGEAGARGQVGVGVPSWRAAGPGSRLPGPAGISSRLHAATRVGLGSAREKECPRRAGEAGGRARGGGAGLTEAGVAPDLGAQGVLQGVLLKRERPWLPKFSLKLRVHWGLIPESLRLQGQRIEGHPSPPPLSSENWTSPKEPGPHTVPLKQLGKGEIEAQLGPSRRQDPRLSQKTRA